MRTKLSARGQVVIPQELRKELGWDQGQELAVERDGDRVVLRPLQQARREALRRLLSFRGILKGHGTMAEYMAEKRAEIDYEDRPRFGK